MVRLIKTKPRTFLLMAIGMIPVLFFTVWLLANIIGPEGAIFNVLLFFGGFIGFYMLWINTICLSLDLVNIKRKLPSSTKKNRILFLLLISTYLLRMIISLQYFEAIESFIGIPLNILIGIIGIVLITYLFYKISDDYIYLVKNRNANLFDYYVMTFYFCFFPFGLLMLHSHVRSLLKDYNIVQN